MGGVTEGGKLTGWERAQLWSRDRKLFGLTPLSPAHFSQTNTRSLPSFALALSLSLSLTPLLPSRPRLAPAVATRAGRRCDEAAAAAKRTKSMSVTEAAKIGAEKRNRKRELSAAERSGCPKFVFSGKPRPVLEPLTSIPAIPVSPRVC